MNDNLRHKNFDAIDDNTYICEKCGKSDHRRNEPCIDNLRSTRQQNQFPYDDLQQKLVSSSHPVIKRPKSRLQRLPWQGLRSHISMIPWWGLAGISLLVFVVIISVVVHLLVYPSAHRNALQKGTKEVYTYPTSPIHQRTKGVHTYPTSPIHQRTKGTPTSPTTQLLTKGSQVPGGTIIIQGSHFKPGGTITFTVDSVVLPRIPVKKIAVPHISGLFALAPLTFTQTNRSDNEPPTIVQNDGTFKKNFVIPLNWLPKSHHTILASEDSNRLHGSTMASLNLTIQPPIRQIKRDLKPCVQSSETTLSFSLSQGHGLPPAQSLSLKNCGIDGKWTTKIEENDNANWLQVNITKGSLKAEETQEISVNTTSANLKPGTYNGTIIFVLNSARTTAHVTLFVTPANICVQTTPASLTFSNKQLTRPFTIRNCGNTGNWLAIVKTDDHANWLSIDETHGRLNTNAQQDSVVKVNTANIQGGTYTGHIYVLLGATVNAQGNPIMAMSQVTVTLHLPSSIQHDIQKTSRKHLITQQLTFSGTQFQSDPAPRSIVLTNRGYSASWTGTVETTTGGNWLTIDQNNGTLTSGATQKVVVAAGMAGLSAGTYTGLLTFKYGLSTTQVYVTLQVAPDCLNTTPSSLKFSQQTGDNPTPQAVKLTNCGGTGKWSLHLTTADNTSWLIARPSTNSLDMETSQNVDVTITTCPNDTCLSAGTYYGAITFTLGKNTQVVLITLVIHPQPDQSDPYPTRPDEPGENLK